jgi:hypothetical protein
MTKQDVLFFIGLLVLILILGMAGTSDIAHLI